MPQYQLRYLAGPGVETIRADTPEDAEDQARQRLLFRDPGFAIAVLYDGVELTRVIQKARRWGGLEAA